MKKKTIRAWAVVSNRVIDRWWDDIYTSFYVIFPRKTMAQDYAKKNDDQEVVIVEIKIISQ